MKYLQSPQFYTAYFTLRHSFIRPLHLNPVTEVIASILVNSLLSLQTFLAMNMTSMSRDSQIFKDPRKYDPDRWNKDSSEETHPFSSLPFGFGPRSCYGQ